MKGAKAKIDYITEYLADYTKKVKLLNQQGLFDEAKHFELFAIELAKIWFGQEFKNCNEKRFNEPYIDLISEDGKIYAQVSTIADIETKINNTLKKIEESDLKDKIVSLKFILLNNDDFSKLNIKHSITYFNKDKDIINTPAILTKAQSDKSFCDALYNLLSDKFSGLENEIKNYKAALDKSNHDLNQITTQINSSYQIDKSETISAINAIDSQGIIILGQAGSGKTATCKLLLGNSLTLFARAESFVEHDKINDVWGFDVERIFQYFGEKKLNIFIDSLEFIADSFKKTNLLSFLLEKIVPHKNIKIFMTCRTSDSSAFIKLSQNYSIKTFEIIELSDSELAAIKKKFPIIDQISSNNAYSSLLKNPWYINMITENISDLSSVRNENDLRKKIWDEVICVDKRKTCDNTKRRETISNIIFNRAKSGNLYVAKDSLDIAAVKSLITDNIITENSDKNSVKAKFDIFEDIYFERIIDETFTESKGNFIEFFNSIEQFGKCVYRRYQIWVSNKLWEKDSQEVFIQSIVFSNSIPDKWKEQTIIGIVKTRNSSGFFAEYKNKFIADNNKHLAEFLKIINLYGFEIDFVVGESLKLKPIGEARVNALKLICEAKAYTDKNLEFQILKLTNDWCLNQSWDTSLQEPAKYCKEILNYHLLDEMASIDKNYHQSEIFIKRIKLLYMLSEIAKEEIKAIWVQLQNWYKLDDDNTKRRFAENVIHDAMQHDNFALIKNMSNELCELANFFWRYEFFYPKKVDKHHAMMYGREDYHKHVHDWGLSEETDGNSYGKSNDLFWHKSFINNLLQIHPLTGIKFIIEFINESVELYKKKYPKEIKTYNITFPSGNGKDFFGNENMWGAYRGQGSMPTILQDMLMCLEFNLINYFKRTQNKKEALLVREIIYTKSNNIAVLPIILSIGVEFFSLLGDYALELASNIDFVLMDLSRYAYEISGLATYYMGMFAEWQLKQLHEFHDQKFRKTTLQQYVVNLQMKKEFTNNVNKLLDALYISTPNDKKHAQAYLNIQRMDFRNVDIEEQPGQFVLTPKIDGAAKELAEGYDKSQAPYKSLATSINSFANEIVNGEFDLAKATAIIDDLMKYDHIILASNGLNEGLSVFIMRALVDKSLDKITREKYIDKMLEGLPSIFSVSSIAIPGMESVLSRTMIFKPHDYVILWNQLNEDISDEYKKRIKKEIIKVLTNGERSDKLLFTLNLFLEKNTDIRLEIVKLIIEITKSEVAARADWWKRYQKDKNLLNYSFEFDAAFEKAIKNLPININVDFVSKDIFKTEILYSVFNLKLSILDKEIEILFEKLVNYYIDHSEDRSEKEGVDFYSQYSLKKCLEENLLHSNVAADKVLSLLFDKKDFSKKAYHLVKFYEELFGMIIWDYFNAYEDVDKRTLLHHIWDTVESKIQDDDNLIFNFYNCLIFTRKDYGGSWDKCPTKYSLADKKFIIDKISKYGKNSISQTMTNLKNLKVNELLPEILIGINAVLSSNATQKEKEIQKSKKDLIFIISKAFYNHCDRIKQNKEISDTFENILEILVKASFAEAAVILDEFRIH